MTLTLAEIHALSNADLRKAIAVALGWGIEKISDNPERYWAYHNSLGSLGETAIDALISESIKLGKNTDWTENMEATWVLFEELRKAFFSVDIMGWDHAETVYVKCHPRQGHDGNLPDLVIGANGAPRAIAEAWLAYHEGKEHNNAD